MLELRDISLIIGKEDSEQKLLNEISVRFPRGHFGAIVGPSGCGKSTLLKIIAGIREPSVGNICWEGRDLSNEGDLAPREIGYVPQFSIAYDFLTVWESVNAAMQLRVKGLSRHERHARAEKVLRDVGLFEIADRQVRVLSGGQKRRLPLAMEMVSSPVLLLCDEVTSGLDPKAEDEIVRLMKQLSQEDNRIVLSVTHSLRHIDLYDSMLVLFDGHLAYHGPGDAIYHYFGVHGPEELFPRLAKRTATDWNTSWHKHRHAYGFSEAQKEEQNEADTSLTSLANPEDTKEHSPPKEIAETGTPGAFAQFKILLGRRWRIFLRDQTQLWLQLALMFGFPCLVVIFAWEGLPQIQNLNMEPQSNLLQTMIENTAFIIQSMRIGGLVSGLVMLQVILLTLIGSNNSAREIASERLIFEKEKFAGVRPFSYVLSKACFLAVLVTAQSVWMAVFVNVICHLPGDLFTQIALLIMVNGAMTAICLSISSFMKTAEQASLVSFYLVGFQLPLSGAVLALPYVIRAFTKPFIASYWGWSGFLQTMRDTRFYDAVQNVTQTPLIGIMPCLLVLGTHIILGLLFAYAGCKNSRWE